MHMNKCEKKLIHKDQTRSNYNHSKSSLTDFIWIVPDNWTLMQASTVPFAYMMVYYALTIKTELKAEDHVLVISKTFCITMAVIFICENIGSKCFIINDNDKLQKIKINHNSTILEEQYISDKIRVRIILNYFEDKKVENYLNMLVKDGLFLDIGRGIMKMKYNLGKYN